MKKTIDGFRYDTEKAILIGEHDTGGSVSDFSYWSAGLYKTPRAGRYFLAGEGHAMTRFASHSNGSSGWGSKLIPISPHRAWVWAEHYLDATVIEEHFSDMIEEA